MPKVTKESRISKELARLNEIYADLPPKKKALALGLIDRAAWMRIECEDLEADLRVNGWTEPFSQSTNMAPYDRARPAGQTYQTLNANYQKIMKQLDGMLPVAEKNVQPKDDGFDDFVNGRDDA